MDSHLENELEHLVLSFEENSRFNAYAETLRRVVTKTQKKTLQCKKEERPEEEWSDRVVLPILDCASELLEKENLVEVLNV